MTMPFGRVSNALAGGPPNAAGVSSTPVGPLGPIGYLNAVDVDAAGKHVYAVGSPTIALQYAGVALAAAVAAGTSAAGTIVVRFSALRPSPSQLCALTRARHLNC